MSQRYFLCEFVPGTLNAWVFRCSSDQGLPAVPHPNDDNIEPVEGWKYLVETVQIQRGYRLVQLYDSTHEIFVDVQPLLLEATWQRPEHVTGKPWVEVTHAKYGPVKAKFHRPIDGRYAKRDSVEIQFSTEDGQWHSFALEDRLDVSLTELERRVRACVGPAVSLVAAINRQTESRRGREQWGR